MYAFTNPNPNPNANPNPNPNSCVLVGFSFPCGFSPLPGDLGLRPVRRGGWQSGCGSHSTHWLWICFSGPAASVPTAHPRRERWGGGSGRGSTSQLAPAQGGGFARSPRSCPCVDSSAALVETPAALSDGPRGLRGERMATGCVFRAHIGLQPGPFHFCCVCSLCNEVLHISPSISSGSCCGPGVGSAPSAASLPAESSSSNSISPELTQGFQAH